MQNLQTSFNKSIPDNTGGSLLTELRIFLISSAVMATYLTKVNKTSFIRPATVTFFLFFR